MKINPADIRARLNSLGSSLNLNTKSPEQASKAEKVASDFFNSVNLTKLPKLGVYLFKNKAVDLFKAVSGEGGKRETPIHLIFEKIIGKGENTEQNLDLLIEAWEGLELNLNDLIREILQIPNFRFGSLLEKYIQDLTLPSLFTLLEKMSQQNETISSSLSEKITKFLHSKSLAKEKENLEKISFDRASCLMPYLHQSLSEDRFFNITSSLLSSNFIESCHQLLDSLDFYFELAIEQGRSSFLRSCLIKAPKAFMQKVWEKLINHLSSFTPEKFASIFYEKEEAILKNLLKINPELFLECYQKDPLYTYALLDTCSHFFLCQNFFGDPLKRAPNVGMKVEVIHSYINSRNMDYVRASNLLNKAQWGVYRSNMFNSGVKTNVNDFLKKVPYIIYGPFDSNFNQSYVPLIGSGQYKFLETFFKDNSRVNTTAPHFFKDKVWPFFKEALKNDVYMSSILKSFKSLLEEDRVRPFIDREIKEEIIRHCEKVIKIYGAECSKDIISVIKLLSSDKQDLKVLVEQVGGKVEPPSVNSLVTFLFEKVLFLDAFDLIGLLPIDNPENEKKITELFKALSNSQASALFQRAREENNGISLWIIKRYGLNKLSSEEKSFFSTQKFFYKELVDKIFLQKKENHLLKLGSHFLTNYRDQFDRNILHFAIEHRRYSFLKSALLNCEPLLWARPTLPDDKNGETHYGKTAFEQVLLMGDTGLLNIVAKTFPVSLDFLNLDRAQIEGENSIIRHLKEDFSLRNYVALLSQGHLIKAYPKFKEFILRIGENIKEFPRLVKGLKEAVDQENESVIKLIIEHAPLLLSENLDESQETLLTKIFSQPNQRLLKCILIKLPSLPLSEDQLNATLKLLISKRKEQSDFEYLKLLLDKPEQFEKALIKSPFLDNKWLSSLDFDSYMKIKFLIDNSPLLKEHVQMIREESLIKADCLVSYYLLASLSGEEVKNGVEKVKKFLPKVQKMTASIDEIPDASYTPPQGITLYQDLLDKFDSLPKSGNNGINLEGILNIEGKVLSIAQQRENFAYFLNLVSKRSNLTGVNDKNREPYYGSIERVFKHLLNAWQNLAIEEKITYISQLCCIDKGYCIVPRLKAANAIYTNLNPNALGGAVEGAEKVQKEFLELLDDVRETTLSMVYRKMEEDFFRKSHKSRAVDINTHSDNFIRKNFPEAGFRLSEDDLHLIGGKASLFEMFKTIYPLNFRGYSEDVSDKELMKPVKMRFWSRISLQVETVFFSNFMKWANEQVSNIEHLKDFEPFYYKLLELKESRELKELGNAIDTRECSSAIKGFEKKQKELKELGKNEEKFWERNINSFLKKKEASSFEKLSPEDQKAAFESLEEADKKEHEQLIATIQKVQEDLNRFEQKKAQFLKKNAEAFKKVEQITQETEIKKSEFHEQCLVLDDEYKTYLHPKAGWEILNMILDYVTFSSSS